MFFLTLSLYDVAFIFTIENITYMLQNIDLLFDIRELTTKQYYSVVFVGWLLLYVNDGRCRTIVGLHERMPDFANVAGRATGCQS